MDPIEQRIRESYARVSREGANVSLDYNLLTVEETRFLLEQLDEARGKSGPTINERFEQSDDEHSFLALARWVDSELARCEASGSIFDTGFRCVSEGGEVFEFDPEVVVKVFVEQEEMIDALGQICCGVAFTNGQYEEHNEHARTHSVCAFCGVEGERTPEAMLAHMKKCEKHPYAEASSKVAALLAYIDSDATGLALALLKIRKHAEGFTWLLEGRGCYEWDDDRYKDEAGHALRPIIEMAKEAFPRSAEGLALLRDVTPIAKVHDKKIEERVRLEWTQALTGALGFEVPPNMGPAQAITEAVAAYCADAAARRNR